MDSTTRRDFLKRAGAGLAALSLTGRLGFAEGKTHAAPNILLAIADDWSWPHASIGGVVTQVTGEYIEIKARRLKGKT